MASERAQPNLPALVLLGKDERLEAHARPATLVVVPEWPSDPPQVLAVAPEQYVEVAQALGTVGLHLNDEGAGDPPSASS